MRKALIKMAVAGLVLTPSAGLAGPALYDLGIFLYGADPFAAAFYGQAPAAPQAVMAPAPAPVPGQFAAQPPMMVQQAPVLMPVTVAPQMTPAMPGSTRVAGLSLDRAYLVGNIGFASFADATNTGTGVNNTFAFDSGVTAQIAYGYRWQERVTTELEVAMRATGAKTVKEIGATAAVATGNVSVLSFLANATYEFPGRFRATPYLMGGLGFARYAASSVAAPGSSTVDSSDWVIGYQMGGGLVYPLAGRWSLDASYRYFATTQPSLKNAAVQTFKTDVSTHNFLVGARYKL